MAYTVKSSERLRPSAADTETKALLYLMNFRDDSDEIFFFVVDFFNDLTGMNKMGDKLWDLQSKGDKQPSPYIIGTELVTLYKNFVSEFEFAYYIIFLGGVSSSLRIDDTLTRFGIDNIKSTAKPKLINGLRDECKKKTYIDDNDIDDTKIDQFLKKVYFVIDDQSKSEYVKKIIKLNPTIIPSEDTLVAIFNEIRDAQSGKKNASVVEGVTLVAPDEALNYGRHLIDKIFEFIKSIGLEQKFLKLFPAGYVINILSKDNRNWQESMDNICEIVFIHVIGHIILGKSLTVIELEEDDYSYMQKIFKQATLEDIKKQLTTALEIFIKNYYENDRELLNYLSGAISGIVVRLKNAADNKVLGNII